MALVGNPPAFDLTALTDRIRLMLKDSTATHIQSNDVLLWADDAMSDILTRLPRGLLSNMVSSITGNMLRTDFDINLPLDYLKTESLMFGVAGSGKYPYAATRIFQEEEVKFITKTEYANVNWYQNVYYYEYTASNSIPNTKTIVTVHGNSGSVSADYKITYIKKQQPLIFTTIGSHFEHLIFLFCIDKAYSRVGLQKDMKSVYNRMMDLYIRLYAEQSFESDRKGLKQREPFEVINVSK